MKLKKIINRIVIMVVVVLALPTAAFAAPPSNWTQRYDITVIVPDSVVTYLQRYTIDVVEPMYITLSTDDVSISVTPGDSNVAAEKTVVLVSTGGGERVDGTETINPDGTTNSGWTKGYALGVAGDTALVCEDNASYTIPTMTEAGDDVPVNSWGFGLGADASTLPATWRGMSGTAWEIASTTGASAVTGDPYNVFFGVKVDTVTPACSYVGDVTFTATKNP